MNYIVNNKEVTNRAEKFIIIFFCFSFVLCPIRIYAKKGDRVKEVKAEKVSDKKLKSKASSEDLSSKNKDKAKTTATGLPEKDYTEDDFKPQVQEESYAWMVIKTLFILGLLIGGFYYFFRFVTKRAGGQILGQDVLQTLSVLPLGQNKYLQVVDLAGKILVLGVTDSSINMIQEITEKEEIDKIRLLSSKSGAAIQKSFQDQVMNQVGKLLNKVSQVRDKNRSLVVEGEKIEAGVDLTFLKNQKNRLKNLNGFENE